MPFAAANVQLSTIASAHDDAGQPSDALVDLALRAASRARTVSMDDVAARMPSGPRWPMFWPGEHYKLLGALVEEIKPTVVIEVGTFQGLSALAIKKHLPQGARLHTFDIVPWQQIDGSAFVADDFADGKVRQELGDLADPDVFRRYTPLLQSAEFIFIDGPKNVVFEEKLVAALDAIALPKRPIVMFDDVRLWNMLAIWRRIAHPKLDITSFGHWSGTGLVHWI
jgi:predicted O-methyltransferase YrrM